MKKNNEIKDSFSSSLRKCLYEHYGKIPSAANFARDFNLRSHGTTPITQESARRWMRGVSLPEDDRLRVLINWLNLDYNEVLRLSELNTQRLAINSIDKNEIQKPQYGRQIYPSITHYQSSKAITHSGNGQSQQRRITDRFPGGNGEDNEILSLMHQLDPNKRKIVTNIIKAINT